MEDEVEGRHRVPLVHNPSPTQRPRVSESVIPPVVSEQEVLLELTSGVDRGPWIALVFCPCASNQRGPTQTRGFNVVRGFEYTFLYSTYNQGVC
jgi:hypothetical protein